MALPRPIDPARRAGATGAKLRVSAARRLDDLRPGDTAVLRLEGPDAAGAELILGGTSAASFRITTQRSGAEARFVIAADAPGLVQLTMLVHGRVRFHLRVLCRAPAEDAAARCERALAEHRARLAALDGFLSSLVAQLVDAAQRLDEALSARALIAPQLGEAREVAMLLHDPAPPEARAALELLRSVWARAARHGVATRAIALLAPGELADPAPDAAAPRAPASAAELLAQIRAAIAREERWVAALLAAWPRRLRVLTARAPDVELAAGIGACTADVSAVPALFWRAWFQEHGLVIRPGDAGPRASWRTGRALLTELGAELPAAWREAVIADVDALAAAVSALGVL